MSILLRSLFLLTVASCTLSVGILAQQSKPACVLLPVEFESVAASPRGGGTTSHSCVFSRSALTLTCKLLSRSPTRVDVTQETVTTFKSVDDVVDQFSVNSPLFLAAAFEASGMGQSAAITYEYDAKRRLLAETIKGSAVPTRIEYTEWDASGRPTRARWLSPNSTGLGTTLVNTYDDRARTKTLVTSSDGVVATTVHTDFDANGHQIRMRTIGAVNTTTTTTTMTKSEKVCR